MFSSRLCQNFVRRHQSKSCMARLCRALSIRSVMQWLAIVLGAASLAACAQTHVAANKSGTALAKSPGVAGIQSRIQSTVSFAPNGAWRSQESTRLSRRTRKPAATQVASHGIASFYTEGTKTASGEKFNTHELTAAHPTLPFGTRLRVTNVASGQSVTVRVNDRGPYVRGRVVDVSHAAAESLGMVGGGVAKVKLDVVQ